MRKLCITSLLLMFALLSFAGTISAQERPSAIISFGLVEDVEFTMHEVEYENKKAYLTWQTVNLTSEYQLVLEAYMVDDWSPITDDTPLPANTTDYEAVLYHPLNFGPIMYRLSIQDSDKHIYDQRFIEIDFALTEVVPTITLFMVNSVEIVSPLVFNANVNWEIANRRPHTNLEFDQIMPDGSIEPIELPRTNLWIASFGQGTIQPAYVMGDIVVRLRVVDMLDGTVYAEIQQTVAPPDVTTIQPTPQPTSIVGTSSTPTPTLANSNAPQLVSLTINPNPVNRLEPFVVTWEVSRATSVTATVQHFITKGNSWTSFPEKTITGSAIGETTFSLADIHYYIISLRIHLDVIGEDGQTYTFASETITLECFPIIDGAVSHCSTYPPVTTNASFQQFEHGFMIWRSDINQVYVMGGIDTTGFFWQQFPVSEGSPSDAPPEGLYAPQGAFAGVWANNENVQGIGWATAPLQSYTMQAQYYPDYSASSIWYLTTPQNIVILIGSYTSTSGPAWYLLN